MALGWPRILFGGTFDPVHHGHLRAALEISELFSGAPVELVPSRDPVHRSPTDAPAEKRWLMLEAATLSEAKLAPSRIELDADRASYTVHTLEQLRSEAKDDEPIVFVLGVDAFLGLTSWMDWKRLINLAHLLVVTRPGYALDCSGALSDFIKEHETPQIESLRNQPAGSLYFYSLAPLDISSTQIRKRISEGRSARYLVPDSVWDLIQDKGLYGSTH